MLMSSDTLAEIGARRLANSITAYWQKKGLDADVRVEGRSMRFSSSSDRSRTIWQVRSDMVNGQPQRQVIYAKAA